MIEAIEKIATVGANQYCQDVFTSNKILLKDQLSKITISELDAYDDCTGCPLYRQVKGFATGRCMAMSENFDLKIPLKIFFPYKEKEVDDQITQNAKDYINQRKNIALVKSL